MTSVGVKDAAISAIKEDLRYPSPAKDGRFNTANSLGSMHGVISDLANQFIKIAQQPGVKVLEIGPAYGNVCIEALKNGASDYTVVEAEMDHLKLMALKIAAEVPEKVDAVKMYHGRFPDRQVVDKLRDSQFDAILAGRMLHYLTEAQLREAFRHFASWLKPNGVLMADSATPYLNFFFDEYVQNFDKDLEHFRQEVAKGGPIEPTLPGFVPVLRDVIDNGKFAGHNVSLEDLNMTRDHAFLMHPEVAAYLLKKVGLVPERLSYCSYEGVWHLDDREEISIVARKPGDH